MYYLLMTLGGANVWSNFSYGSRVDTPNGWLHNPQSRILILFEKCKKSARSNIKVYTHLFHANHLGEPGGLKNTRLHDLDSAFDSFFLIGFKLVIKIQVIQVLQKSNPLIEGHAIYPKHYPNTFEWMI